MPCTAPVRGKTDLKYPWDPDIQNDPCGAPILTQAAGVDVSAANLCKLHWQMRNGQIDLNLVAFDDFNRPDENPISNGGRWITPALSTVMEVISGKAGTSSRSDGDGWPDAIWAQKFPSNQYVYATIVDTLGESPLGNWVDYWLLLRFIDANNCYAVDFQQSGVEISKRVAHVRTVLATAVSPPPVAVGQKLGFSASGSQLTAYVNDVAVVTVSDSTFTSPGNIGIGFSGYGGQRMDNFGGGAL